MAVSLDKLREIGRSIDPSQQVQSNEVAPVLSALIYHQQHGRTLEQAAEKSPQEVSDLLAGRQRQPGNGLEPVGAEQQQPAAAVEQQQIDDEFERQQREALSTAHEQQTQVEHEPAETMAGDDDDDGDGDGEKKPAARGRRKT